MPVLETSPSPSITPASSTTATPESVVSESPLPETALPENDTGAVTSPSTCQPAPTPYPAFETSPSPFTTPALSTTPTVEPVVPASPSTEPEFPDAVAGAVTSPSTCQPTSQPMPVLDASPAPSTASPRSTMPTPESVVTASPAPETALPDAVSGVVQSVTICQPVSFPTPTFETSPEPSATLASSTMPTPEPVVTASFPAETALPASVTGAVTSAGICQPELSPKPALPISLPPSATPPLSTIATPEPVEVALSSSAPALPDAVTGIVTSAGICQPAPTP